MKSLIILIIFFCVSGFTINNNPFNGCIGGKKSIKKDLFSSDIVVKGVVLSQKAMFYSDLSKKNRKYAKDSANYESIIDNKYEIRVLKYVKGISKKEVITLQVNEQYFNATVGETYLLFLYYNKKKKNYYTNFCSNNEFYKNSNVILDSIKKYK